MLYLLVACADLENGVFLVDSKAVVNTHEARTRAN